MSNIKVSITSHIFNESNMLPFYFDHYKSKFKDPTFIIYNNMSTDNSKQICLDHGATVVDFNTNGEISHEKYQDIKNNSWKNSKIDWQIVCDTDELIFVDQDDLDYFNKKGITVPKFKGYQAVPLVDYKDIPNPHTIEFYKNITHGVHSNPYSKYYMFNKAKVNVKYFPGAHKATITGKKKFSDKEYIAMHYHAVDPVQKYNKYLRNSKVLSKKSKQSGLGKHYSDHVSTLEKHINNYIAMQKSARVQKLL